MAGRTRGKVFSRVLLALALFTTVVSVVVGEQQHVQPCEGLITKPYLRGSGLPCMSFGQEADLATTSNETMLLPSRRRLDSGDTAGSVGGIIISIIIIGAIAWCIYAGKCCCNREVVVINQPPPPPAPITTAVSTSNPVSIVNNNNNNTAEPKGPTVQYVINYPAPERAGCVEMMAATAVAGNALAHAQAGNHMGGGVSAGFPVPAPVFPAYAPPPQHTPSQPQQAYQQPNPLSNYPSDKGPGPKKP